MIFELEYFFIGLDVNKNLIFFIFIEDSKLWREGKILNGKINYLNDENGCIV